MKILDYANLTKPRITVMNLLTAMTGFIVAGGDLARLFPLMIAGYLAAGGSSVLNHYIDREADAKMLRTKSRPIPSKRVHPTKALALGIFMTATSLLIAGLSLNLLATLFIALGSFFYVLVYTVWLKKRTHWNIVIGGAAGSFPPLAGWAAATGTVSLLPILIAVLIFLWTPGHFWALAIRAKADYERANIPMLPNVIGVERASFYTALSNFITVIGWMLIVFMVSKPLTFAIITAPFTAYLLASSIELAKNPDKATALRAFKASSPWLAIIMVGLIVQSLGVW